MNRFALREAALDRDALAREVLDASNGALVVFEGIVRDHHHGRAVLRLEYEAYAAMAEREGRRIVEDCARRFEARVACEHRLGPLAIGEAAVVVAAASPHRDAAFAACRAVIDAIKRDVPIWKREFYADGTIEWQHPVG